MLGIALSVLDGSIVNLALPSISRDLHSAASESILVVNAYQVATLAMLLPCAAFGDRLGYRRVYLIGVAVFTAASAACLLASSLHLLIAARAIQGLGAAGIMGVNAALVRLTYPSSMLGRGIALNSVVVAASSVAGPSIAAAVLSLASWHWLFALNIPLGLLLLWLGSKALPSNAAPAAPHARLFALDVGLNVLFFSLMFIGINSLSGGAGKPGQLAPTGAGLSALALAIILGVVYYRRQRDQPTPLLPVDLLRIPVFALVDADLGVGLRRPNPGIRQPAVPDAGRVAPQPAASRPGAHGMALRCGGRRADRGAADRALSRRFAGRHRLDRPVRRPDPAGDHVRSNRRPPMWPGGCWCAAWDSACSSRRTITPS